MLRKVVEDSAVEKSMGTKVRFGLVCWREGAGP